MARRHNKDGPPPSPEQADAWLAKIIGARGTVAKITTANPDQRRPAKWWLRQRGVSSEVVNFLPAAALLAAWNDTTDATLRALIARKEVSTSNDDTTATQTTETGAMIAQQLPLVRSTTPPPATTTPTTNDAQAEAAALLAKLLSGSGVSENRVREIVLETTATAISNAAAGTTASLRKLLEDGAAKIDAALREAAEGTRIVVERKETGETIKLERQHSAFPLLLKIAATRSHDQ